MAKQLKSEVAEKYNLKKGLQVTTIITKAPRIQVDLAKMTLAQADAYAKKYDFLVLKDQKPAGDKSSDKNKKDV